MWFLNIACFSQVMFLTKAYIDAKVTDGGLQLPPVVCIKKMILITNILEHGVLNLTLKEMNT